MLTVNGDRDVVERQLAGGELACPSCGGVLGGWGNGRLRPVRVMQGPDAEVVPRRSRCRQCGGTHVLLPAWCLLRRADAAAVIGAALEAAAGGGGHRKIAGWPGRAVPTVRGWLRRFAGRAEEVRVFFTVLLARTAPDPVMPASAAGPVPAAVSAVAGAAAAVAARWPLLGEVPVWTAASAANGGHADLGLLPAEAGDRVVDTLEGGLGIAAACGQGRCRARCGGGAHAHASSPAWPTSPCPARSAARKATDQTRWK